MRAIVLGASGDIGKNIAAMLKKKGYDLTATCHSSKEKSMISLDMNNKKSIDAFSEKVLSGEKIDFFISTIAERPRLNKLQNTDISEFESSVNISLNHLYLLKKLLSHFNKDALILFLLSEMVINDKLKYASPYMIGKYTMLGIFKALSSELKDIRVNAISPGMIDTKFLENIPKIAKESYDNKYGLLEMNNLIEKISEIIENKKINGQNLTF